MNKIIKKHKYNSISILGIALFFYLATTNCFTRGKSFNNNSWGNPGSHSQNVIANFDVVPYQVFNRNFKVGVVAFHEAGVNVQFIVMQKGSRVGPAITKKRPTYNSRTGVYEYGIKLKASNYSDGKIMVIANCTAKGTKSKVKRLTLPLYSNYRGKLYKYSKRSVVWADCNRGNDRTGKGTKRRPYKTIGKAFIKAKSGGTVYLKAGKNYFLANNFYV